MIAVSRYTIGLQPIVFLYLILLVFLHFQCIVYVVNCVCQLSNKEYMMMTMMTEISEFYTLSHLGIGGHGRLGIFDCNQTLLLIKAPSCSRQAFL